MLAELLGDHGGVAGNTKADHGLPIEAELHRIGDGDDLHDAGIGEFLHALAYCGLAESDGLADLGI